MRGTGHMVCAGIAAGLLALAVGCRESTPKGKGLTLHFVFRDAKGITVGKRVMGDGISVGQVSAPPHSPRPKHVVVSVRIDGLAPEKMVYLTDKLTASIKKDSLVAGELFLELIFPDEPGETVPDGAVLPGRNGWGGIDGLHDWPPKDLNGVLEWLRRVFVSSSTIDRRNSIAYLNWGSLVAMALAIIALLLDLLIRLPQGAERDRSSPRFLRDIWLLFCLALVARFFSVVVCVLGGMGVLDANLLFKLRIPTDEISGVLAQEWPFWALAFVLISFRFRFSLLTRVKKG